MYIHIYIYIQKLCIPTDRGIKNSVVIVLFYPEKGKLKQEEPAALLLESLQGRWRDKRARFNEGGSITDEQLWR